MASRFTSGKKASRIQRTARPAKKTMVSACHCPGTEWKLILMRLSGSEGGAPKFTSCCQKVPPKIAASPGWTAPTPTAPSWASPPPMTMGVPAARPVWRAAAWETSPKRSPDS